MITAPYLSYMWRGQRLKSRVDLSPHSGVLSQHKLRGKDTIRVCVFTHIIVGMMNTDGTI